MFFIDRRDAFLAAVARETAHAAVAEHLGFELLGTEIDWRGFPVCRYGGEPDPAHPAIQANLLILVAGPVGERMARGEPWGTADEDIGPWMGANEIDPGDHPDSAYDADLLLALRAVDGDVDALRALERDAHRLLTGNPDVRRRWHALRETLSDHPHAGFG